MRQSGTCKHPREAWKLDTGCDVLCEVCGEVFGVVARFAGHAVLNRTEAREVLRGLKENSGVVRKLEKAAA